MKYFDIPNDKIIEVDEARFYQIILVRPELRSVANLVYIATSNVHLNYPEHSERYANIGLKWIDCHWDKWLHSICTVKRQLISGFHFYEIGIIGTNIVQYGHQLPQNHKLVVDLNRVAMAT